jgi:hypothetical protein
MDLLDRYRGATLGLAAGDVLRKLGDSGNIGRFGIGFISTFQFTDSPEIRSGDLQVHLQPERTAWNWVANGQIRRHSFHAPMGKRRAFPR